MTQQDNGGADITIDFDYMRKNWTAPIPFDMAFGIVEKQDIELVEFYEKQTIQMKDRFDCMVTAIDALLAARSAK